MPWRHAVNIITDLYHPCPHQDSRFSSIKYYNLPWLDQLSFVTLWPSGPICLNHHTLLSNTLPLFRESLSYITFGIKPVFEEFVVCFHKNFVLYANSTVNENRSDTFHSLLVLNILENPSAPCMHYSMSYMKNHANSFATDDCL